MRLSSILHINDPELSLKDSYTMYPLNLQTKEVLGRYSTSDLDIHPAISHSSPALFNRNRK